LHCTQSLYAKAIPGYVLIAVVCDRNNDWNGRASLKLRIVMTKIAMPFLRHLVASK
jgi:hypothetical protein